MTPILLALLFVTAGNAFGQIDPSALYRITAKHSGRCLAVAGGMTFVDNGVGVIQWDCIETEDNQKWRIMPVGFGYFKIVAKHSGKSLEVRGGAAEQRNGFAVQQWDYVGAPNQKWRIIPVGDGTYQIVAAHSGKSLDISGGPGATGNGPYAQQWDYWGGDNQKWRLTPIPDRVTATFTYTDTEADPGGPGTFNRPIANCLVQVWRAGVLVRVLETNANGAFNVTVPPMPDGTDTTVILYATNSAAQVLAGVGPYFVRRSKPAQGNATLDFSENLATAEQVRSFNAAHDIRLAHAFARARRDPQEREVIPRVDASFNDLGVLMTHYNAPAGGLVINREHEARDIVIMHEYAHFLEDKIGSFLLLPSYHDTCYTTQRCQTPEDCARLVGIDSTPLANTQLINTPENAWMEGFAEYFAMAVKRANPSERFNLTGGGSMTEAELNNPAPCGAVGRAAFDGHTINGEMVERYVASALWELTNNVDQVRSETAVFQIFDRELDGSATGVLPNIASFRRAWNARGLDSARLDNIIREHISPGP